MLKNVLLVTDVFFRLLLFSSKQTRRVKLDQRETGKRKRVEIDELEAKLCPTLAGGAVIKQITKNRFTSTVKTAK